jgi:hypothetical protein
VRNRARGSGLDPHWTLHLRLYPILATLATERSRRRLPLRPGTARAPRGALSDSRPLSRGMSALVGYDPYLLFTNLPLHEAQRQCKLLWNETCRPSGKPGEVLHLQVPSRSTPDFLKVLFGLFV